MIYKEKNNISKIVHSQNEDPRDLLRFSAAFNPFTEFGNKEIARTSSLKKINNSIKIIKTTSD